MRLNRWGTRGRGGLRSVVLIAVVGAAWHCTDSRIKSDDAPYARGRIHQDRMTTKLWNTYEDEAKAAGKKIQPWRVDSTKPARGFESGALADLDSLKPSMRHGANDKRLLSKYDSSSGRPVSSEVVAEITLIKGIEYKEDADFQKGWLPLAIIMVLPDTFSRNQVAYKKLNLYGGTSWVFVHEDEKKQWTAAIVRKSGGRIEPYFGYTATAAADSLEPVIGARFVWEPKDESIWAYCGGKCCKVIPTQ